MGTIKYNKKHLQIKIIGHFDGYTCGMITALRHFEILNYIHLADEKEPITTFQLHNIEDYEFYVKKIKEKVKLYGS